MTPLTRFHARAYYDNSCEVAKRHALRPLFPDPCSLTPVP
jgi:hypothetical protein